jgi:hypothetical protein
MIQRFFFILLVCSASHGLSAQQANTWSLPDAVARSVPDSAEQSVSSLSTYFGSRLQSDKDLVRAFYLWTATEISYDPASIYNYRASADPSETILRTLESRKAVCQGYAEVFHALCDAAGIANHIVPGYTRQQGKVVAVNHAWVLARIDGGWYGFDPTWGSGLMLDGRYIRRFSSDYFMMPPQALVATHMPFDPMWQCLERPVTAAEFSRGNFTGKGGEGDFHFNDSIDAYERLPAAGKFSSALRRLEKNGVTNNATYEYRQYLLQNLEIEETNRQNALRNEQAELFNDAVNHYNTASLLFNDYINYWNRQFKPLKPDDRIRGMVDTCSFHLSACRNLLGRVSTTDETIVQNKELLLRALDGNQQQVDWHYAFLRKYFGTPKAFRASLFGRISIK